MPHIDKSTYKISDKHPEYCALEKSWKKLRDVYQGEECVKKAGKDYLKPLKGHENNPKGYTEYCQNAVWFDATYQTVNAVVSTLMSRMPLQEGDEDLFESLVPEYSTFELWLKKFLTEMVLQSRVGVLIDITKYIDEQGNEQSYPYLVLKRAEEIIWWEPIGQGRTKQLGRVVLIEQTAEDKDPKYRELLLGFPSQETLEHNEAKDESEKIDLEGKFFVALSRLWAKNDRGEYIIIDEYILTEADGTTPLNQLPFFFANRNNSAPEPERPQFIGLADMNVHDYQLSAKIQNIITFASQPMLSITSDDPNVVKKLSGLRSDKVIGVGKDGKAEVVEPGGNALKTLNELAAGLKQNMALIGAKALELPTKQKESAESLVVRTSGERNLIDSLGRTATNTLTLVVQFAARLAGYTNYEEFKLEISKDVSTPEIPLEKARFIQSIDWMSNELKHRIFQSGGIIPEGEEFDYDPVEDKRLQTEAQERMEQNNNFPTNQ